MAEQLIGFQGYRSKLVESLKLNDEVIANIAKLVQIAILTGTDIVDNLRLIRLQSDGEILAPHPDFVDSLNSNIQKMLNDELECFKEIHANSKLIADDLNEATNDTLVNLLIEREKRIKTIQLIENERKSLDISEQKLKLNYSTIYSQIKEVLLQIVQIDAKLMDIVSAKKDSILSELKEIDKIKKMSSSRKLNEAKIIDIRQS